MKLHRVLAALVLLWPMVVSIPAVQAQDYERPPRGFDDPAAGDPDYPMVAPRRADAPDAGSLAIRMSKAENRIREMTGQLEELQNANRRLVEQLQKFQADVDTRLAAAGPRRHTEADTRTPEAGAVVSAEAAKPRKRRDDAFDPAAAPDAPGRPRPLGSDDGDGAPIDLAGAKLSRGSGDEALAPTLRSQSAPPRAAVATAEPGTVAPPNTPRGEFDAALELFRDKQYDEAEKGFSAFMQKNPKSKLAADATYYLGESYAQRGRNREAAEQYLKISTDYAASNRAPDAMLHLGMSLKQLGAKEQACATFTEIGRKYPNAPNYVKTGAEREAKRAQC